MSDLCGTILRMLPIFFAAGSRLPSPFLFFAKSLFFQYNPFRCKLHRHLSSLWLYPFALSSSVCFCRRTHRKSDTSMHRPFLLVISFITCIEFAYEFVEFFVRTYTKFCGEFVYPGWTREWWKKFISSYSMLFWNLRMCTGWFRSITWGRL